MSWNLNDTWIILIGCLSAVSCALLGTFLVLRRMSMMGDAISHAVLPGLVIAFMWTGSRASVPMFLGAAGVGVLTALLTQWVKDTGKVEHGASMGVVFTTLFALGLILFEKGHHTGKVDLDPECVLYGAIELAPLNTITFVFPEVPIAFVSLLIVMIINIILIALFYKELKISSFDPALATTLGINATFMHYLLMTMVAVTTVAAFESIGSIIVIALLIVPAASAHLLTNRLVPMLLVAVAIGILSAVLGHVGAIIVPPMLGVKSTTTAGMIGSIAGLLFLGVMLLAPQQGVISRWLHQRALSMRIVREDVLGLLYRLEERSDKAQRPALLAEMREALTASAGAIRHAARQLAKTNSITRANDAYALTDSGRTEAQSLIRAHRLWETYLEQNLPLSIDHLHAPAEHLEHVTDAQMRQRLAEETSHPTQDPMGKQVPD
ncbi:MAG: metal ABC transporter permease [Phycisphaeraceae bacterium]